MSILSYFCLFSLTTAINIVFGYLWYSNVLQHYIHDIVKDAGILNILNYHYQQTDGRNSTISKVLLYTCLTLRSFVLYYFYRKLALSDGFISMLILAFILTLFNVIHEVPSVQVDKRAYAVFFMRVLYEMLSALITLSIYFSSGKVMRK